MPTPLAKVNYLMERFLQRLLKVENSLPPTKHAALRDLGDRYGFQIITNASVHDEHICFDELTDTQKDLLAALLAREFGLYSKEVLQLCGLKRIILAQNLTASGKRLAGMAELGLWLVGSIVLDAAILGREEENKGETIHHELFHAIDYRDDLSHYVDTDWVHLNAPGFRYNADLSFVDMPPFDHRDVELPEAGFLNTYSTQNPYEDKATVYAALIIRYHDVMDKASTDEILARKVAYMKRMLNKFHPYFNESFWTMVQRTSAERKHRS